MDFIKKKFR